MWFVIVLLALAGTLGTSAFVAWRKPVAALLFFVVYVIALLSFAVQAVLESS
jgi:hypothetical protein